MPSDKPRGRLVALALASGLGTGYVPVAPVTFGSAIGLLIWAVLPTSGVVHAVVIVLVFATGTWAGGVVELDCRRTDPSHIVVDEVVGMLVSLFLIPVGWAGAVGAFLLFRFFDVIKPYPANRLERLHGGLGVMADDAMAGVYANLALRAILIAGMWG
jgi:phosphatidylglycerophosphatase A